LTLADCSIMPLFNKSLKRQWRGWYNNDVKWDGGNLGFKETWEVFVSQ